jgi:tubulin monoglycylase TTLL3/8
MLSAWGYVEWREGSTGVYGLDLMLDTDLRMWLIEVNKSPCMSYSTAVTANLIPRFQEDLAKVLADPHGSDTGDLELILEQPFVREP